MGTWIARLVLVLAVVIGYEVWAADELGLPRLTPGHHPLLGDWQEASGGGRTVEFRRDHSGMLHIPHPDDQSEGLDVPFGWNTRAEVRSGRIGHVQISFDRADYSRRDAENVSAPCRFRIVDWEREEEKGSTLTLEGSTDCVAFMGQYH